MQSALCFVEVCSLWVGACQMGIRLTLLRVFCSGHLLILLFWPTFRSLAFRGFDELDINRLCENTQQANTWPSILAVPLLQQGEARLVSPWLEHFALGWTVALVSRCRPQDEDRLVELAGRCH